MISDPVKYYSTNLNSPEVTFSQALLKGIAPDGGLYLPVSIPVVSSEDLKNFRSMKYDQIAYSVLNKFIGTEIESESLAKICSDAYDFDVPLENIYKRKYIMRLDQGPTASFKDFAARIMSRLMQYYLAEKNQHLTILTATSGDTGSAVANAFYGMKNIDVIILFPENEVTSMQRKQMTTLHNNIKVIALDGKFDDCQALVKKAFMDPSLSGIPLSSANSINIGRLLPQSVYYFYAWSRLTVNNDEKVVFSVPSGNFGNLMGGIIAKNMGLPVRQFIISTNVNNEVPEFMRTGSYKPINPSRHCISSAMNVGHPSNLPRVVAFYGGIMDENGHITKLPDMQKMRRDLFAVSVSDDETRDTIYNLYKKENTLLEPHGAVAWKGMTKFMDLNRSIKSGNELCISLETAHPAKFPEELKRILNLDPSLPSSLEGLTGREEKYLSFKNNYDLIREFILNCE